MLPLLPRVWQLKGTSQGLQQFLRPLETDLALHNVLTIAEANKNVLGWPCIGKGDFEALKMQARSIASAIGWPVLYTTAAAP